MPMYGNIATKYGLWPTALCDPEIPIDPIFQWKPIESPHDFFGTIGVMDSKPHLLGPGIRPSFVGNALRHNPPISWDAATK